MTVYILGGGPAGLGLAHGLTENPNIPFTVLEQGASIGGLAQTLQWENYGFHDLGPHKIFTLDQNLMQRVENLLTPADWLTRPKVSSIYMKNHFLPYPPSPFSLLKIYGAFTFALMVANYGMATIQSLFNKTAPKTFEEDLKGRLGQKLYAALFKPIALKLWGEPNNLDVKLSKGRVQTPSIREVIGRIFKIQSTSDFEALEFRYPRGGLQKIWEALQKECEPQGDFQRHQEITAIRVENERVVQLCCKDRVSGEERDIEIEEGDFVFSTIPIGKLPRLMNNVISEEIETRIQELIQLNDLLLVFLKLDVPRLFEESWIFVPDPNIAFHRISEQESFDPGMTPGGSIVCCEIMDNETRPMSDLSNEELIGLAKKGLTDMGYTGFTVLDQRVIRLPYSYPVFRPGFEPALQEVLQHMDHIANFRTIGRQGAFNYIGTLDAMDIGYGSARWFLSQKSARSTSLWQEERERTGFYPVLD